MTSLHDSRLRGLTYSIAPGFGMAEHQLVNLYILACQLFIGYILAKVCTIT